jgi:hypothetical protein
MSMIKKIFPDKNSFVCVFLTMVAAVLIVIDTTGIMSLVGLGIGVGGYLGNLLFT